MIIGIIHNNLCSIHSTQAPGYLLMEAGVEACTLVISGDLSSLVGHIKYLGLLNSMDIS